MSSANVLTITGLSLDIIGVIILYCYTLPIEISNKHGITLYTKKDESFVKKVRNKRLLINRIALLIIICGFLMQLIGIVL